MSAKISFEKGSFQQFRVLTQVHLGRLERYLEKGDIVDFDGHTLKFEGADHSLPQLRGAIMAGWLVPADDTTTTYKAKSANIKIRPAKAANIENRGKEMKVERAFDDNRIVGRAVATPVAETGDTVDSNEGKAVAKISTPTRHRTKITDSSAAQNAINKLDNSAPPSVKKIATGDVEEALVGESLEDVLPEAAVPVAGKKASTKKTSSNKKSRVVTLENGIEWDMGRHWRTRGRDAARTYANDSETLNLIRAIEVPSVTKMIESKLGQA